MTPLTFPCFAMDILDLVTSKIIASFEDHRSGSTATVRYTDMLNLKERLSVSRFQSELISLTQNMLWQERKSTRVDSQIIKQSTFPEAVLILIPLKFFPRKESIITGNITVA